MNKDRILQEAIHTIVHDPERRGSRLQDSINRLGKLPRRLKKMLKAALPEAIEMADADVPPDVPTYRNLQ